MAVPRIPNPAELARKSAPPSTAPVSRAVGGVSAPQIGTAINRTQPRTAPPGVNSAPAGRPPTPTTAPAAAPAPAGPAAWTKSSLPSLEQWQTANRAAGGTGAERGYNSFMYRQTGEQPASSSQTTAVSHSPASAAGTTRSELGDLRGGILDALHSGLGGLYTPDDQTNALGGLKADVESGVRSQINAADADAARRGLFRSGMAGAQAAAIRRGGSSDYSRQANDMQRAMREANLNARMGAAGQASQFLSGERNYQMQQAAQRRAAAAASAANAPISLFNEETGQMETIDPRIFRMMF